jgi:hypothetical protein
MVDATTTPAPLSRKFLHSWNWVPKGVIGGWQLTVESFVITSAHGQEETSRCRSGEVAASPLQLSDGYSSFSYCPRRDFNASTLGWRDANSGTQIRLPRKCS